MKNFMKFMRRVIAFAMVIVLLYSNVEWTGIANLVYAQENINDVAENSNSVSDNENIEPYESSEPAPASVEAVLDGNVLNNGVYYYGEGYSIFPEGFVKYKFDEGDSEDLPLVDGLDATPKNVYFIDENDASTGAYLLALDNVAPTFTTDNVAANSNSVTITETVDGGSGGVAYYYSIAGGNQNNLVADNVVNFPETHAQTDYEFWAVDALGNASDKVTVTVNALDVTAPTIENVVWNNETINMSGTIYCNSEITIEADIVDNDEVYSSLLNEIKLYKVEDDSEVATFTKKDGTDKTYEVSLTRDTLNGISGKELRISAKDNADNIATFNFTVVYDTDAPTFTSVVKVNGSEILDSDILSPTDFDNNGVNIEITVIDNVGGDYCLYQLPEGAQEQRVEISNDNKGNISVQRPSSGESQTITFYVYDKAGNRSEQGSVTIRYDVVGPTISLTGGKTVDSMEAIDSNVEEIYTNDSYYIGIFGEDANGVSGYSVVRKGTDSDTDITLENNNDRFKYEPTDVLVNEEALYEISAIDNNGNTSTKPLKFIYDIIAPVATVQWESGGEPVTGEWGLSKDNVKILVNTDDTDIDKVLVIGASMETAFEITDKEDDSYVYNVNATSGMQEVYTVTVIDRAGNSSTYTVNVKIDDSLPTIELELSNEWRNGIVSVEPTVRDTISMLSKLYYKVYRTGTTENVAWNEKELNSASEYEHSFDIIEDGIWTVELKAVDNAGNESEIMVREVKIDTAAPNVSRDKVFVTFKEVEYESVLEKILNIFRKDDIEATIYIQDNSEAVNLEKYTECSQIDSVKVKYNGEVFDAEHNENIFALISDDGSYSESDNVSNANKEDVYQVFTVTLRGVGEITSSKMTISEVIDNADNLFTGDVMPTVLNNDSADNMLVIIDKEIPVLTNVQYGNVQETNEKYFINAATNVSVAIKEHFFENSAEPVVKLYKKEIGVDEDFLETTITLAEWAAKDGDIYETSFELPGIEGKEVEYYFTIFFEDRALNKMTGGDAYANEVSEEGVFTSKIVVVDKSVPVLNNLSIVPANGQEMTVVNNQYFVINQGEAGINFEAEISDSYFNQDNLEIDVYKNDEFVETVSETEFDYDIDDNTAGSYQFTIYYIDNSGNKMVLSENATFNSAGVTQGTLNDGCYKMANKVVMDKAAPVLSNMSFTDPYNYVDNMSIVNAITDNNTKLYYNTNIDINFAISEDYYNRENVVVNIFEKSADGTFVASDVTVSGENSNFNIALQSDGEYYFTVDYSDYSENDMVSGTAQCNGLYNNAVIDGVYTSPIFIRDTVAPIVGVEYVGTVSNERDNIKFYQDSYTAQISIKETNFFVDDLKKWAVSDGSSEDGIVINAWKFDTTGAKAYSTFGEIDAAIVDQIKNYNPQISSTGEYLLELPISQEANYELGISLVDLAGNETVVPFEQTVLDRTNPTMEASYKVEDGGFLDFIKYGEFGYLFGKKKLTVSVDVTDEVSGARKSTYTLYKESANGQLVSAGESKEEADSQIYKYNFVKTIPVNASEKDFKGMFEVMIYDGAGNSDSFSRNYVAQSQDNHNKNTSMDIAINTTPSRIVDGMKYYNAGVNSVNFTVTSTESYSGLKYVEVNPIIGTFNMGTDAMPKIAANQSMEGSYKWNVKNNLNGIGGADENGQGLAGGATTETYLKDTYGAGTKQPIVTYFTHSGNFPVNDSNNKDDIAVEMKSVSNTNYENTLMSEAFCIDTVLPVINVSYNNAAVENGHYYREPLTATVTITERNFSSKDIVWKITNSEGKMPAISDFTNDNAKGDDGMQHVGTVTFSEDGDYTFEFTFQDKAGNEATYSTEPFTIDITAPEIQVTYDNNTGINNYYSDSRVATVQITEHNFQEEDVVVNLAARNDGADIAAPSISRFSSNGDVHTAIINYDYDAEFNFSIAYTDMAGNEAEAVEEEHFVVDLTDPEIIIENIEEFSANKGSVEPSVSVTDTNLELAGVIVELNGYKNGLTDYPTTRTIIKNGQNVTYSDLPYEEGVDDMYTLNVTAVDKSGRTVESNVVFSVNRFGSTYQFNDSTKKLLEKYYSNEEQEVVITETNVDTLEFKELYMLYNGEKVELTEGKNYKLVESGNDVTWKQYKYVLNKNNFENEGVYNIVVYSEDRAENESDNRIKNSEMEFVIDKTAPTVQISGLEDDTQYVSKERLVTIDVKDNMELQNMDIYLNNQDKAYGSYSAEEVNDNGGVISLNLKNSNSRQNIVAVATDRAGNESRYEIKDFLITTNLFVQFYQNKPLFYGTIGGIALIIVVVGYFVIFGKKKKSE